MKIDRLLDFYEDIELESYFLQKDRLLEGIVLDYSFIRIDPFKGIKRKNNIWMIDDLDADSGIYSFLMNSDLFFIINEDVSVRMNFERILLFKDEYYEFQITSGGFTTKPIVLQLKDLLETNFFEQDELVFNLIKSKNIKLKIKLREPGKIRAGVEDRINIEDTPNYADKLLQTFLSKITNFQLDRTDKIYLYLQTLEIPYEESLDRSDLNSLFRNIKLAGLNIKKNVLYMNLLFNRLYRAKTNDTKDKILEEVETKYDSKIKKIKLLEYKLKAKYITVRDKNDWSN